MLKWDKHTDPSVSVIYIAGLILEVIKKSEIIEYDALFSILAKKTSNRAKEIYHYALSFLFLVGKIEYVKGIDAVRLVK